MRVTFNCERIDFFTGYRTDASKWDAENQRATGMNKSLQTASEINDHLDYLKAEIIKVFRKYELMDYLCIVVTSTLNFSPLIFRSVPNLVGADSEETIPGLGKRLPHFGTSVWGKI